MKKFTGNVFGFSPNLYLTIPYWGKVDEVWSAQILEYNSSKEQEAYVFLWQGSKYVINLKPIDEARINYQGRIIADGEAVGKVYLMKYSNKKGMVYWGEWGEDDKKYNLFIEIIH